MRPKLKVIRSVLLAAGIVVSLAFGANEAMGCVTCTQPPPTACNHYQDPDLFCENLCVNTYYCYGGMCKLGPNYCLCFEK
jgi:hypothetical protein